MYKILKSTLYLLITGLVACSDNVSSSKELEIETTQKEYWINFYSYQQYGKVHSEIYNPDSIVLNRMLTLDHEEFLNVLESEDSIKMIQEIKFRIVEEKHSCLGGTNYNLFFYTDVGSGLVYNDAFGPVMRYAAEGFEYVILRQDCYNDSCADNDLSGYLRDLSEFEEIPGFFH